MLSTIKEFETVVHAFEQRKTLGVMVNMITKLIATAAFLTAASAANAVTFTFDSGDGNGFGFQQIDTPDAFGLTMVGADTDVPFSFDDPSLFSTTAAFDASYEISWSFFAFDEDGPAYDPFGYFVEDVFVQLSDDDGANFQFGSFVLDVLAGDVFGFFIKSTDDVAGPSNAFIAGQEIAPIPLPASGLLLMAGLGGLALRRRKT